MKIHYNCRMLNRRQSKCIRRPPPPPASRQSDGRTVSCQKKLVAGICAAPPLTVKNGRNDVGRRGRNNKPDCSLRERVRAQRVADRRPLRQHSVPPWGFFFFRRVASCRPGLPPRARGLLGSCGTAVTRSTIESAFEKISPT
ncbi:Hypothetical protein SMAX5B_018286 [Scophthalmus maximus]|uniref:Uncharacterized protein n=1 Tax=Scophthalmus maximus TaxID=52904 RepID=A0A2U9C9G2_SCOMX|nr:Hypothetical protein SMAX5B_018286 [Scophthalmus maximus]